MARSARVVSLDVLRDFKAALIEFAEAASRALTEGESDIQRTVFWLQNQQAGHWKREVKKRTEKVAEAKNELFRAQLAAQDDRAGCVLERKALAAAQHRLEEAEQKVAHVRRWAQLLDREKMLYKAHCQQLGTAVEADLPKAVAWIEKMSQSLDEYLAIAPPVTEIRTAESAAPLESEEPRAAQPIDPAAAEPADAASLRRLRRRTPHPRTRDETRLKAAPPKASQAEPADGISDSLVRRLDLEPDPPGLLDKVVLAAGCLTGTRVYLERIACDSPADSGWFAGDAGPDSGAVAALEAIRVADLVRSRPILRELLALPPGFLIVLNGETVKAVLNEVDINVWSDELAQKAKGKRRKE